MTAFLPIGPALDRGELRDGNGFLAYGRHVSDSKRAGGYRRGDHWWAIIQWDIWREPHEWVFCKDGSLVSAWGEPTHYQELLPPRACAALRGSIGGNDPQDCNWPFCGCDPAATKVLEAVEEADGSAYARLKEAAFAVYCDWSGGDLGPMDKSMEELGRVMGFRQGAPT